MNEVLFADARVRRMVPDETLPAKFRRLLQRLELPSTVRGQRVAIKMHFGGNLGYSTIHPVFVRILADAVKEAGAREVWVTDWSTDGALGRGYTEEVLGVPVRPCYGKDEGDVVRKRIGFGPLKWACYGRRVWEADVFIDFAHLKGHGNCGFGGAIKNIAMGTVDSKTRGAVHSLEGGIVWHAEKCVHCNRCIEACPNGANSFDEEGNYKIFFHHCTFCQHCIMVCPKGALELDAQNFHTFQEGFARVAAVFLKHLKPNRALFINVLTNITAYCDCWGMTTPSLVPDIGILAGRNIVAVETASLNMIKASRLLPEGLPIGKKLAKRRGHLFERISGKNPWVQVQMMDRLGFGPADYKLIRVR